MTGVSPRYSGFSPVLGDGPHTLILGTFPSPVSREKCEYYGNPRNQFWRIIFDVFGEAFDSPSYARKTDLLIRNRVALWDVIESCEALSALDSSIKNPSYNNIGVFLESLYGIQKVLCNGAAAGAIYRKLGCAPPCTIMPSTSPANARMRYFEKLEAWRGGLLQP